MTLPDIDTVTQIIRETAEAEILPRFGTLRPEQIHIKTHANDLVTEADTEAEKVLTDRLTALLPGSVAVGEEAVHKDSAVLERLLGEAPVWVLDPVDGTSNFARGNETFGVIVALIKGGRTVAGWIHDPINNTTVIAEEGSGATESGAGLAVAQPAPLSRMIGMVGCKGAREMKPKVERLRGYGSAAHVYLNLARGSLHFALFKRLQPWDHAAGVLIHREAGGYGAHLDDGTAYRPVMSQKGLLMAPDRSCWEELAPHARACVSLGEKR